MDLDEEEDADFFVNTEKILANHEARIFYYAAALQKLLNDGKISKEKFLRLAEAVDCVLKLIVNARSDCLNQSKARDLNQGTHTLNILRMSYNNLLWEECLNMYLF